MPFVPDSPSVGRFVPDAAPAPVAPPPPRTGAAAIPTAEDEAAFNGQPAPVAAKPAALPKPVPTIGEKITGAVEAGINAVSGLAGSVLGIPVGLGIGVAEATGLKEPTGRAPVPSSPSPRSGVQGSHDEATRRQQMEVEASMAAKPRPLGVGEALAKGMETSTAALKRTVHGPMDLAEPDSPDTPMGEHYTDTVVQPVMEAGIPLLGHMGEMHVAGKAAGAAMQGVKDAAAYRAAPGVAERAKAAKLEAPALKGVADANKAGYILSPSEAKAGAPSRAVEGLAGEPKLAKSISKKNAETTNRLTREDVGLPEDEPISRAGLARIRAEEGKNYAVLKQIDEISNDKQYIEDVDRVTEGYDTAAESFPHRSENPFQKVADGLRQSVMKGSAAVEEVKLLRGDADTAYGKGDKALGRAYRSLAEALDNSIDRHLTRMSEQPGADPSLADGVARYRAARKRIAKTYLADSALNDSTGNIDAGKYAAAHKRSPNLLSGPGLTIAKAAEQFPRMLQKTERLGNTGGPTIMDAGLALLGGKADIATAGARPVVRAAIQTKPVQKFLTRRARRAGEKEPPAAPPGPPPEPTTSPGAGGPHGGGGGGGGPGKGPLGDLTPDWSTTPGAGGGRPRGGHEPGLVPSIDDTPPTTGNRKAPLEVPAVPGRPDLPDSMTTGGPAEVAATERANKAMVEPGAIEARRQQADAAEKARRAAEPKLPVGEVTEGAPAIKSMVPKKPLPVGKVIEGQPEIKAKTPEKIKAGEATELPVETIEPKAPIDGGEVVDLTPEQDAAWRKHFGLSEPEAARAKAVSDALKHDGPAVEAAAVQHENSPRAFDREIARINEEAKNANESKRAAESSTGADGAAGESGTGGKPQPVGEAAARAADEQPRPNGDAAAGTERGAAEAAGGQKATGAVDLPGFEPGDTPQSFGPRGLKGNSWVIREKATGKVVMETRDPAKVRALNTEKYEAVPAGQHLAELNKKPGGVEIREVPGGFEAHRDGKKVGYLKDNLERGQAEKIGESANVDMVKVDKEEQGKGTGRALYAAFHEKHGGRIMPSGKTEPSAWKLWKRNYPDKVDAFVKQEAARINDGADPQIVARNITDPEVRARVLKAAEGGKKPPPPPAAPPAPPNPPKPAPKPLVPKTDPGAATVLRTTDEPGDGRVHHVKVPGDDREFKINRGDANLGGPTWMLDTSDHWSQGPAQSQGGYISTYLGDTKIEALNKLPEIVKRLDAEPGYAKKVKGPELQTEGEFGRPLRLKHIAELEKELTDAKKGKLQTGPFSAYKSKADAIRKITEELNKAHESAPEKYASDHLAEINKAIRAGKKPSEANVKRYGLQGDEDSYSATRVKPKATETPAFKKWFGKSEVVDAKGEPLRVYHGTVGDFDTFNRSRANPESDMGAGFYFSDTPADVAHNYANHEGPDLSAKIERRAEALMNDDDSGAVDWEHAMRLARQEIGGSHDGATMPVHLKMEKPLRIGGKKETFLDYERPMDAEGEFLDEPPTGTLAKVLDSIERQLSDGEHFDGDFDRVMGDVGDYIEDGMKAQHLIDNLRSSEGFMYVTDENGNLVSNEVIRQAFQDAGFDGIIDESVNKKFGSEKRVGKPMAGMKPGTTHYVVFKPEQIKSAIGNRGTFDANDPSILHSEGKPTFYSPLARGVAEAKQAKAPAGDWQSILKGLKGVKAEEIEWSGVGDWLQAQGKRMVTRDEIGAFLKEGGVKVEEVQKGEKAPPGATDKALDAWAEEHPGDTSNAIKNGYSWEEISQIAKHEGAAEVVKLIDRIQSEPTKYGSYTLPGGTNYREVLLTLPKQLVTKQWETFDPRTQRSERFDSRSAAERAANRDESGRTVVNEAETGKSDFKSAHWDEPNILAHIRLNDRVDAQGRKVLFVEEIQSDWAQQGKRVGFQTAEDDAAVAAGKAKYAELKRQYDALEKERQDAKDALTVEAKRLLKETHPGLYQYSDLLNHRDRVELTAKYRKLQDTDPEFLRVKADVEEFDTEQRALYAKMTAAEAPQERARTKVPDAPFVKKTEAWTALAIKRITKMAADEGYDRVAFVNGEQSAARYDLSKQVSEIKYDRGSGELIAHGMDGDEVIRKHVPATAEALEEYIGKEAAEKLAKRIARADEDDASARQQWGTELDEDTGRWFMRDENGEAVHDEGGELLSFRSEKQAERSIDQTFAENLNDDFKHPTIRGLDLKVGGEGMKAFYDQIVPNVARDVVKKLGGDGVNTGSVVKGEEVRMQPKATNPHTWQIENENGKFLNHHGAWVEPLNAIEFRSREAAQEHINKQVAPTVDQIGFDITPKMREQVEGGVPLFQKGEHGDVPVGSPEKMASVLREKFGDKLITGLLDQGLLKFALSRDEGMVGDKGGVKAILRQRINEPSAATLYFDRISAEKAPGILMHELGEHFGAVRMLGAERYVVLMDELRSLNKRGDPEVRAAWKHVEDNYVGEGTAAKLKSMDDPVAIREVAAHLVEKHPDLPWVRRLINEIRAFFYEKFGTTMGNRVDANLMRGLAAAALRKASKGDLPTQRAPQRAGFKPFVPRNSVSVASAMKSAPLQ